MSEIEERIDELNDSAKQYRDEEKRAAGAVVSIENNGEPLIYRGLVRAEDKRTIEAVKSRSTGQDETGSGDGEEPGEAELSGALVEDLTAQRTAALRAVLITRPDVALVAIVHNLALQVCYEGLYGPVPSGENQTLGTRRRNGEERPIADVHRFLHVSKSEENRHDNHRWIHVDRS